MPASQHQSPKSDIEISQAAKKRLILDVARERLGIAPENLEPYGHYKAKVSMDFIKSLQDKPNGKLILVSAITPTPAGEGKTTTTVGLTDALNYIGKKAMLCLREPSLGPSFGVKGGAAGGGYAQVVPMEDINLHFTGDFHAITSANNLLAALLDNHIYWGNALGIDQRRVAWRRVLDMNDRALRSIVSSLGGVANGFPREDGFDITVASEVMAIFCLARDLDDLKKRLGNIVVAYTRDRKPIRASDLKAHGAMTVLLKEALAPNLVQTLEGTPAFIHGGPFANIAHGCNSVLATTTALKLADYVVTEAGFGADLGGEKFMDIKCRKAGIEPSCAVLVATIRALKMHGGVKKEDLKTENLKALEAGMSNLKRHVENVQKFGIVPVISINRFSADTEAEIKLVEETCKALGVEALDGRSLGDGRRGRGQCGQGRGQGLRQRQEQAEIPLSRRHAALRKDPHHRQGNLSRQGYFGRQVGARSARQFRSDGLRQIPDLRRQDAIQLLDQSRRQGRAGRSHRQCARSAALGRRRIRGRDLRRGHDHAGPAEGSGRRCDRHRAGRQDRGTVLNLTTPYTETTTSVLKFYYSGAPNPTKVALFLEEAGLPYDAIPVDTRKGEQHKPEFLAINPNAKLPAIVDGDVTVFDSSAILLYLAEKTGKFLPAKTDKARGELLSWMFFVSSGVGPYFGQAVHFRNYAPEKLPYAINRYVFEAQRHAGILDARLAKQKYMLGDTYTIVDMNVWGWARMLPNVVGEGAWDKFKNIKRLVDEISARPAAQTAGTLKDRHKFKTEMDQEALHAMFPHLKEKVA